MTTTGEGEPREDGLGRGGDNPPPTNRATGAQGHDKKNDESIGGQKTAALLCPQRGTAADNRRVGTPTRHIYGTDGARPKHSALARREYNLLAPTGTAVDPANAGDPGSAAGQGATGEQDRREP